MDKTPGVLPDLSKLPPVVAWVDEPLCIGCTKCIQACPFDAILGAAQQMHTVINELCTGCELCLPPCPVDCIEMQPYVHKRDAAWVEAATGRYEARVIRLDLAQTLQHKQQQKDALCADERSTIKAEIAASIQRARAKRQRLKENRPSDNSGAGPQR